MSRRGGRQPKTISMYRFLDDQVHDWKTRIELAVAVSDEFGRSYDRAYNIVSEWINDRGFALVIDIAGGMAFVRKRPDDGKTPPPSRGLLISDYWGRLPESFRRAHRFAGMSEDAELHLILLAYNYYVLGRTDSRIAFNRWAERNGHWKIQKEL